MPALLGGGGIREIGCNSNPDDVATQRAAGDIRSGKYKTISLADVFAFRSEWPSVATAVA